ncbi:conserved Plasmodium protein, unknown function [Plasmodium vinckei vinckei]|uniref:Uncharacterized protein n=1 Tax=Plasmodium vinckei vinckei TaxID=54757 RepID=A0A449BX35_PLAVN|nr:conserved Plasmodium protein, unknown function [Plasmodium vinckei vinckei]KEG03736.1 hypothetical protein YYE_01760 [Plasmodium vinckei vinckei]VEV58030.1 conserved Plasmodium protein, unknown function [Plasmodium vinckei vinckei]
MSKFYIKNLNNTENSLNDGPPTYMEDDIPKNKYRENNSIVYGSTIDIYNVTDKNGLPITKEFDFVYDEQIDNRINFSSNNINDLNIQISNSIQIYYKSIFRYAAECSSFLCAVGMWGVLEDIFRILSEDDTYIMFYYYFFFALIFASLALACNLCFNESDNVNKCAFNDLENQE